MRVVLYTQKIILRYRTICRQSVVSRSNCSVFAVSLLLCAIAISLMSSAVSASAYKFTVLDTLGGPYSIVSAINNTGQVAGYTPGPENDHAVKWDGRFPIDLHPLNGTLSQATDINDSGQVVGWSHGIPSSGETRAMVSDGVHPPLFLKPLDGGASWANAINNSGSVVGNSSTSDNAAIHATVWQGGDAIDLGTLGGTSSFASGINDIGQIVGESQLSGDEISHATLWDGTSLIDLGAFAGPSHFSFASDINNRQQVIGGIEVDSSGIQHVILWNDASVTDLGQGLAADINNNGQIVGTRDFAAWLWDQGTGSNLNEFLDMTTVNAGWYLRDATGINDSGWITGTAVNSIDGRTRAYVLTPVPEPATAVLMLLGLGVIAVMMRCRSSRMV